MKKTIRNIIILLFPFVLVVVVNELAKVRTNEKPHHYHGVRTINSAKKLKAKCSWVCHNTTDYCKTHHVKFVGAHFDKIDPLYFGIIHALKGTGEYSLANIIFLVILLPLVMYVLIIKSLNLQSQIDTLRRH